MQIGKKRKHIMFIRICLPIVAAASCILNDKEQYFYTQTYAKNKIQSGNHKLSYCFVWHQVNLVVW